MASDPTQPAFPIHALLEFQPAGSNTAPTCALLTPAIKARLGELASGQVLEVRVSDPTAQDDILSWSRLTGHQVLAVDTHDPHSLRFFLRKK